MPKITFVDVNDNDILVNAPLGKSLLDIAQENYVEVEGACGGELACSTCHCILEKGVYEKLPKPSEEEDDMLDLAVGLSDT